MTDDRLRALERRFRETGTVEDEAAWLRERVRVGSLATERLELAALCGREAACLVSGSSPIDHDEPWFLLNSIEAWKAVDLGLKFAVLRRAGLALLRRAVWPGSPSAVGLDLPSLLSVAEATEIQAGARTEGFEVAWATLDEACSTDSPAGNLLLGFHEYFAEAYDDNLNAARGGCEAMVGRDSETALETIQTELVPWLLGYGDPVRDRVEARKAAGE